MDQGIVDNPVSKMSLFLAAKLGLFLSKTVGRGRMAERKRERAVRRIDSPMEPRTVETKTGKQTKFVLDVGDIEADADQIEELRSSILKNSIQLLRDRNIRAASGEALRPKIGVELFSVSFSVSFSLGA
jgi:hypothetical protein